MINELTHTVSRNSATQRDTTPKGSATLVDSDRLYEFTDQNERIIAALGDILFELQKISREVDWIDNLGSAKQIIDRLDEIGSKLP